MPFFSNKIKQGMNIIDRGKKMVNNQRSDRTVTTIPTGGFAGRNQIGGQSVITIVRSNPATKVRSKSSLRSSGSSGGSYRDDGTGRAMSESARTKFIKDKNPDYTVKKTPQGATYGVRNII